MNTFNRRPRTTRVSSPHVLLSCLAGHFATCLGLSCLLSTTSAHAAPLLFTIDPNLSSVTVSVKTTTDVTFTSAQFAGADTTSIFGTMLVDVVPGTSVQFLATGDQNYSVQPADVAPGPGAVFPGSAPGNFGLLALIPGILDGPGPGGTGVISNRNIVGDSTSGVIPLVAGNYDSTQVTQVFMSCIVEFNLAVFGNPVMEVDDFSGAPVPNLLSGGTLVETPLLYTLTLPFLVNGRVSGEGIVVIPVYSGQIVATARVPEPSSMVIGCVAAVCLAASGWRRRSVLKWRHALARLES